MRISPKRLFVSLALAGALVMPNAAFAFGGSTVTLCDEVHQETFELSQFEYTLWLIFGGGALWMLLGLVTDGPCEEQPQAQTTGDLTINKYIDQNANQTQDGGEGAHEGVTFTITGPNAYSETAQTDATGQISLNDLEPGDYTVTETVPNQYRSTTGASQNVSVEAGDIDEVTFGNQELGKLRLKKYMDVNGDGDQDAGDTVMPGVQFHVTGPEGYDATFTTNSSGLKHLFNLVPGEYTITETVPAGYEVVGSNPRTVNVGPNQAYANIGNKPAGKLRLKKYEDLNGDGDQDAGEGTMSSVQFTITGPNGYSITKSTNPSGLIKLFNLVPGEYTITETVPAGYNIVGPNPRTKTVGGSLAYVNIGNEPIEVEVEATPTPTPEPTPTLEPTPEVEGTPEVEATPTPDPTDDPGVTNQGTQSSTSQSSDPGTSGSTLAPVSFADTGLDSLAGLGTSLISIGAYAAVRRRLRS